MKKFKCLLGKAEFEEPLDDDRVDATWNEPPELGLIPSKPLLPTSIVIALDNDDGIFESPSEPPGLGSAATVIGINKDDGVDETSSKPPGLGSIPDEPIVIKTWNDPPGLGLIPSEPLLSSSIDDGIGTAPGEQHKKIRDFEIDDTVSSEQASWTWLLPVFFDWRWHWDISWGAAQEGLRFRRAPGQLILGSSSRS